MSQNEDDSPTIKGYPAPNANSAEAETTCPRGNCRGELALDFESFLVYKTYLHVT